MLPVSRDLPTSPSTSSTINLSVVFSMHNTLVIMQKKFQWPLLNAISRQFIWSPALGQQGGESIRHQKMIQYISRGGQVLIATFSRRLGAFLYDWIDFSSSRILNRVLKNISPWFRQLQKGQSVRLLLWWLLKTDIHLWCNLSPVEATIMSHFVALSVSYWCLSHIYHPHKSDPWGCTPSATAGTARDYTEEVEEYNWL